MPLQYLGVGLSKTATKSLCEAMKRLNFRSLHWGTDRLEDVILGNENAPNFRLYDDFDFVCDLPHAYFFREIWQAYPTLKFILTERAEDRWYQSLCDHFTHYARRQPVDEALHMIVYGSPLAKPPFPEFLCKKRFRDWNRMIKCVIPEHLLLVMNICDTKDDNTRWKLLCDFVGKPSPGGPFPCVR